MDKEREIRKQRLLAIVLFALAIIFSWFFLISPSLSENSLLKKELVNKEKTFSDLSSWPDSAEKEAQTTGVKISNKEGNSVSISGEEKNMIQFMGYLSSEGLVLSVKKKGRGFIVSW